MADAGVGTLWVDVKPRIEAGEFGAIIRDAVRDELRKLGFDIDEEKDED